MNVKSLLVSPNFSPTCGGAKDSKVNSTDIFDFIDQSLAMGMPGESCITCTPSRCSPPGNYTSYMWGKPKLEQRCLFCTNDYQSSYETGSCQDSTNRCYNVNIFYEQCGQYWCDSYELTECGEQSGCEDNDGDGYYGGSPLCILGNDCEDDNADINPGEEENCDSETEDENCNGLKNCEEQSCRDTAKRGECDEQCDKDGDGYFSIACGGEDCKDDPDDVPNAADIYPGHDVENTAALCDDGLTNDCDDEIDCIDTDCRTGETNFCPQCTGVEICNPSTGDEDCDGLPNCSDIADCGGTPLCPNPTPTPTPDPEPSPTIDLCGSDPCCGRGTHTECTGGECEPDIEICWENEYTEEEECETHYGECEPEWCVEVCN